MVKAEVGKSYRLLRDFEVRDEKTGTLKHLIRKGEVVTVVEVDPGMNRVYLEGLSLPAALEAFQVHIQPAEE